MALERVPAGLAPWTARPTAPLAERLERGEIIVYERCPFPLPEGSDLRFLLAQRLRRWGHKNISLDPRTGRIAGFRRQSTDQRERLRSLLDTFSRTATTWLANQLPSYVRSWQLDRVSLRPEEEATRRLRLTARNDLLHVDAFPTRPSHGRRILRLFVNINPSEPRVWATSESFARLLNRYGRELLGKRQKGDGRTVDWSRFPLSSFLSPFSWSGRSAYDRFMLRLHDFLKMDDRFQERAPKRFWTFPPGSAWLVFSDGIAHAEVRGQHALEHSYFVPPEALSFPAEAPAALLTHFCKSSNMIEAA